MNNQNHMLHFYGELRNDQWTVMCLNFPLAVQADTLSEAKKKIEEQVDLYLKEALDGQDREHVHELLNRSAPFKYWAKYYWHRALSAVFKANKHITENRSCTFAVV